MQPVFATMNHRFRDIGEAMTAASKAATVPERRFALDAVADLIQRFPIGGEAKRLSDELSRYMGDVDFEVRGAVLNCFIALVNQSPIVLVRHASMLLACLKQDHPRNIRTCVLLLAHGFRPLLRLAVAVPTPLLTGEQLRFLLSLQTFALRLMGDVRIPDPVIASVATLWQVSIFSHTALPRDKGLRDSAPENPASVDHFTLDDVPRNHPFLHISTMEKHGLRMLNDALEALPAVLARRGPSAVASILNSLGMLCTYRPTLIPHILPRLLPTITSFADSLARRGLMLTNLEASSAPPQQKEDLCAIRASLVGVLRRILKSKHSRPHHREIEPVLRQDLGAGKIFTSAISQKPKREAAPMNIEPMVVDEGSQGPASAAPAIPQAQPHAMAPVPLPDMPSLPPVDESRFVSQKQFNARVLWEKTTRAQSRRKTSAEVQGGEAWEKRMEGYLKAFSSSPIPFVVQAVMRNMDHLDSLTPPQEAEDEVEAASRSPSRDLMWLLQAVALPSKPTAAVPPSPTGTPAASAGETGGEAETSEWGSIRSVPQTEAEDQAAHWEWTSLAPAPLKTAKGLVSHRMLLHRLLGQQVEELLPKSSKHTPLPSLYSLRDDAQPRYDAMEAVAETSGSAGPLRYLGPVWALRANVSGVLLSSEFHQYFRSQASAASSSSGQASEPSGTPSKLVAALKEDHDMQQAAQRADRRPGAALEVVWAHLRQHPYRYTGILFSLLQGLHRSSIFTRAEGSTSEHLTALLQWCYSYIQLGTVNTLIMSSMAEGAYLPRVQGVLGLLGDFVRSTPVLCPEVLVLIENLAVGAPIVESCAGWSEWIASAFQQDKLQAPGDAIASLPSQAAAYMEVLEGAVGEAQPSHSSLWYTPGKPNSLSEVSKTRVVHSLKLLREILTMRPLLRPMAVQLLLSLSVSAAEDVRDLALRLVRTHLVSNPALKKQFLHFAAAAYNSCFPEKAAPEGSEDKGGQSPLPSPPPSLPPPLHPFSASPFLARSSLDGASGEEAPEANGSTTEGDGTRKAWRGSIVSVVSQVFQHPPSCGWDARRRLLPYILACIVDVDHLLEVFTRYHDMPEVVQQAVQVEVHRLGTALIRSGKVLELLSVMRRAHSQGVHDADIFLMANIVEEAFDAGKERGAIIETCREMASSGPQQADLRCLIPVLQSLPHAEVLACLHHGFMNLEEHWMKRAVKRLFTVPGVKPPITPHEFLAFVTAQVNRPNYLQATRICYEDTEAFPLEVKKAVMLMFQTQGRITDFFMRGLTLTGLVHKEESHAFIIQILHDLLQRQVWKDRGHVWKGFKMVVNTTAPSSFRVMADVPLQQFREWLDESAADDLRGQVKRWIKEEGKAGLFTQQKLHILEEENPQPQGSEGTDGGEEESRKRQRIG